MGFLNTNEMAELDEKFTLNSVINVTTPGFSTYEEKLKRSIDFLGKKYLLHPANKITKKETKNSEIQRTS